MISYPCQWYLSILFLNKEKSCWKSSEIKKQIPRRFLKKPQVHGRIRQSCFSKSVTKQTNEKAGIDYVGKSID